MSPIGNPRVRGPGNAVKKGDVVAIKSLIKHPMESGLRRDKSTGQPIPAHFIEHVTVEYGGQTVMKAQWTGAISKNPFFSFYVRAEASGPLHITWKDNKGQTFKGTTTITVA